MNKQQLLEHLSNEVYCRLKPGSHGVGVFAVRNIPANTNPFPGAFAGDYIELSKDDLTEVPLGVQSMIKAYCVFEDNNWIVPNIGLNRLDISFFLNHSKNPNLKTEDGETFFTLREIEEGEELLSDYDTYSEDTAPFR